MKPGWIVVEPAVFKAAVQAAPKQNAIEAVVLSFLTDSAYLGAVRAAKSEAELFVTVTAF